MGFFLSFLFYETVYVMACHGVGKKGVLKEETGRREQLCYTDRKTHYRPTGGRRERKFTLTVGDMLREKQHSC